MSPPVQSVCVVFPSSKIAYASLSARFNSLTPSVSTAVFTGKRRARCLSEPSPRVLRNLAKGSLTWVRTWSKGPVLPPYSHSVFSSSSSLYCRTRSGLTRKGPSCSRYINESFRQREIVLYHGSSNMFISSPQEIVIRMVFAVASPSETTPLFTLVRLQLSRFRRVMCRADFQIRDPDGQQLCCASLLLDTACNPCSLPSPSYRRTMTSS